MVDDRVGGERDEGLDDNQVGDGQGGNLGRENKAVIGGDQEFWVGELVGNWGRKKELIGGRG